MTLSEIKSMDKDFLTPEDVAPLLRCDPHGIRVQAQTAPQFLGFPVCQVGNRTKIPRVPFLKWVEGELPIVRLTYPPDNPATR